jgi:hypothetical protein
MRVEHRIYTEFDVEPERAFWECSCGASGTAPNYTVDLASDRHIPKDEMRIDTNKPLGEI